MNGLWSTDGLWLFYGIFDQQMKLRIFYSNNEIRLIIMVIMVDWMAIPLIYYELWIMSNPLWISQFTHILSIFIDVRLVIILTVSEWEMFAPSAYATQ